MKLISVVLLLWPVVLITGCSEKMVTEDELLSSLRAAGYIVVKEGKIHHSLEGAQQAFWLNIDGNRISAYRFDTIARAKLKAKTFQSGLNVGFWAFEYVDRLTAGKIEKTLLK